MVVEQGQRPIRTTGRRMSVVCDRWRKIRVLRTLGSPFKARSGGLQPRAAFLTSNRPRRAGHPKKHLDRSPDATKHSP